MQTISHFYDKNKKVLIKLYEQFKLLVGENYEKEHAAPYEQSRIMLSQEKTELLQNSNLPSSKLKSLIGLIKNKSKEYGLTPYSPKEHGKYNARKVPPKLNEDSIKFIFESVRNETSRINVPTSTEPAEVSIYCASRENTQHFNINSPSANPRTSSCSCVSSLLRMIGLG